MPLPDFYLQEAHQANADADRGREIALRLQSRGSGLGNQLSPTRINFTPDVWDSVTARIRQIELAAHSRVLRRVEDDLDELVVQLRAFADDRELDAAYFRRRYHEELAEAAVEATGPL